MKLELIRTAAEEGNRFRSVLQVGRMTQPLLPSEAETQLQRPTNNRMLSRVPKIRVPKIRPASRGRPLRDDARCGTVFVVAERKRRVANGQNRCIDG
jgi:hypothetical protein